MVEFGVVLSCGDADGYVMADYGYETGNAETGICVVEDYMAVTAVQRDVEEPGWKNGDGEEVVEELGFAVSGAGACEFNEGRFWGCCVMVSVVWVLGSLLCCALMVVPEMCFAGEESEELV